MLRNCISNNFISQQGSGVLIRRNKIESCALLQSEYEMYIELDALRQYVHVNNTFFHYNLHLPEAYNPYIEDDWENVYRYEKEKTTIS